jgi:hypothetical protein
VAQDHVDPDAPSYKESMTPQLITLLHANGAKPCHEITGLVGAPLAADSVQHRWQLVANEDERRARLLQLEEYATGDGPPIVSNRRFELDLRSFKAHLIEGFLEPVANSDR